MKILKYLFLVSVLFSCDTEAQTPSTTAVTIGTNSNRVTTSSNGRQAFWLIGDSFMSGNSNMTGAGPDATGKGYYFRTSDNTIQQITTTDIPGALDGSPWPEFCIQYFNSTGIAPVVIPNGIGGAGLVGQFDGSSATYTAARQDAQDAMTAMGVTGLSWVFIHCGVADAVAGTAMSDINTALTSLIYQITIDFPGVKIGYIIPGRRSTQQNRVSQLRGLIREAGNNFSNVYILCQIAPYEPWGLYGADLTHLSQTGNNFLGDQINRYLQLSPTYNKWTRSIYNSFYSTLSVGRLNAIETFITTLGDQYKDLVSYNKCKVPDRKDVFVDWGFNGLIEDKSFDFVANSYVLTDPATSKSLRQSISPDFCIYRFSFTDFGMGVTTYDRKGAFGTSTKYLAGVSVTAASLLGMAETSTGQMQYFAYDAGFSALGSGGFADNTQYSVDRIGVLKSRVVNGVVAQSESTPVVSVIIGGVEIGARYTAASVFGLNTEINNFFYYKASTWDRLVFYNADVALEASW